MNIKRNYQKTKLAKENYESDDDDDSLNEYETTIYSMGNKVYFYNDIDHESILHLKKIINQTEIDTSVNSIKYGFDPYIELHISSNGGDVFMGLDMFNYIKKKNIRIDTYVDGMIASAATFVFLAGKNRYITKYGHILIHQLSTEFWGKYEDLKDEFNNSKALMECIKDLYKQNTDLPQKKLNDILKRELYLTSSECEKYNIAEIE